MKNQKIIKKHGFTLVECIVAMAVLAIASLLLTMILSVTVKQRNSNMQIERAIDSQIEEIAVTASVSEDPILAPISFDKGGNIPADSQEDVKAKKKFYTDVDGNIKFAVVDYNFDQYVITTSVAGSSTTSPTAFVITYGSPKVSGYSNVNDITINETNTATKTTWTIKFKGESTNYLENESVKIALPSGIKNIAVNEILPGHSWDQKVCLLSNNILRIQTTIGNNEVQITFDRDDSLYTSLSDYFQVPVSNPSITNQITFKFIIGGE